MDKNITEMLKYSNATPNLSFEEKLRLTENQKIKTLNEISTPTYFDYLCNDIFHMIGNYISPYQFFILELFGNPKRFTEKYSKYLGKYPKFRSFGGILLPFIEHSSIDATNDPHCIIMWSGVYYLTNDIYNLRLKILCVGVHLTGNDYIIFIDKYYHGRLPILEIDLWEERPKSTDPKGNDLCAVHTHARTDCHNFTYEQLCFDVETSVNGNIIGTSKSKTSRVENRFSWKLLESGWIQTKHNDH